MNFFIQYGWHFLVAAISGEIIVPIILAVFYRDYNSSTTALSVLGNVTSPVRKAYNLWMFLAGIFFLLSLPRLYNHYYSVSPILNNLLLLFIAIFAVGACIFTCFSV